ncbi:PHP domain-containing protein [Paenibacillus cremeus]|uniref:PHP domain-containing protein n=1 Tax=Paenibacillus cremeus TaxID=2163881 RepID=A0A559KIT4_9BACL|nr:PHP domain-containing protein [Paenibacillus cremeus]TVY12026.1 PHP domain-containing protein [Paenibacillus cremeus]
MLMDLHMHSNYSDGKNTPEEMIEAAIGIGYEAIAITDHVWKSSSWVQPYASHLRSLKQKYRHQIQLFSGIEAKVTSLCGDIDADPTFDTMVDLVLGSIHRIPKSDGYFKKSDIDYYAKTVIIENWLEAFNKLLENPRVDIIAHPLSELKGFGIRQEELPMMEITDSIAASGKILELNVRYNTADDPVIRLSADKGTAFLISSDSHSVQDLVVNSRLVRDFVNMGMFRIIDIQQYLIAKKEKTMG